MKRILLKRWNHLGVQEKLHILIQGSLIVIFVVSTNWVIGRFEKQIIAHAEQRAYEMADEAMYQAKESGRNTFRLYQRVAS